jgi:predicted metal-dependent phosphoesterase TrpH
VRVDLHVHTRQRSACGKSSEVTIVRAAIRAGLDAIVFTDHDRLAPRDRLAQLNAEFAPFRVFGGVEVTVLEGEHVLVVGLYDQRLESREWAYPDLHAFVRERAGYLVVAHPFRYVSDLRIDLARYRPDAIEGTSNNTPVGEEARILSLADELGIQVVSNSDAHHADRIGAYWNVLNADPADEFALVTALRSGVTCGGRG